MPRRGRSERKGLSRNRVVWVFLALPPCERRHPIPPGDFFFGLFPQLQVLEMHIVGMPAGHAHQPVQHLLGIPKGTMGYFQINDDLATAVRTIRTQHALAHALMLFPPSNPVGDARHYTGALAKMTMATGGR